MQRIARIVEILVGVFFLLAAFLKALDVEAFQGQITLYRVISDPLFIEYAAYATVFLEAIVGAALIAAARWRGLWYAAALGMTTVYTCLIVYAWVYHDLADCGCFGKYVQMGPVATTIKNVVLVVLLGWTYGVLRPRKESGHRTLTALSWTSVACVAAVAILAPLLTEAGAPTVAVTDASRPLAGMSVAAEGEVYDLGEGRYYVAMLSATCEHCQAAVPTLNELWAASTEAPMVALMLGDSREIDEFRALTDPLFPMKRIEFASFLQLVGTEPPRLIYASDGAITRHWDWKEEPPEIDAILKEVGGASD